MPATHHATSADGTRIAWSAAGDGPTLVLVDGALCQRTMGPSEGLTDALSDRFTVVSYDRRGRGESDPGTSPWTVEREVEDLAAVIDATDGPAHVFGASSGGTLLLEAARRGVPMERIAVYESPVIVDDTGEATDPAFARHVEGLVERGERGEAVAAFMRLVGTPRVAVAVMRLLPVWRKLTGVAHTLPHDLDLVVPQRQGRPWTAGYYDAVTQPAVVFDGGKSPTFMRGAQAALAEALPHGRNVTLDGQTHIIKPKVLAPALTAHLLADDRP